MTASPDEGEGDDDEESVTFTVNIEDGTTEITMRGDRDTAVIVRSESGERIYLPPEDFRRGARERDDSPHQSASSDSPYQSAQSDSPYQSVSSDSPYQSAESDSPYQSADSDSPYQPARQTLPSEGLVPTSDGYRIRHPEPVTDVRVLR
ncbi:DUF7510 family protein [Halopelagius longus]|uniref:Uncharacterized protein n=1 Tax=Halopelagius longus TaxID=1236180 RepID=A0A1H1B2Z8_9EURY|nr:hypothetical protein [Halopelagius longus]RDI70615.1 hypothetical protein DWB78_02130 [Halopelagius longus]SDQ46151.1 hypothetical protein SAMN05216278_1606 [Halopelagius longus]